MPRLDTDIAPADRDRYTLDGDAAVEARIAHDQELVAQAVTAILAPPAFRGLVLMGGYGRGEGGFVRRDGHPEPYNDYDYFVVVRGLDGAARAALSQELAVAAKTLEHQVGVEVDFALLREDRLPGAEYSLMNAEMLWGHRVVAGDPQVLATMPPMPFASLPPGEYSRLLLNRGSLLLMNQRRLANPEPLAAPEQEVLFKYLFKAILACGDARLAGSGCYHPSYLKKIERLEALDWSGQADFMALYRQAWENKFHPDYGRFAGEDARAWQGRVVPIWLATLAWFEQVRSGRPIPDWTSYASPGFAKGQGGNPGGDCATPSSPCATSGPPNSCGGPPGPGVIPGSGSSPPCPCCWKTRAPRRPRCWPMPWPWRPARPGRTQWRPF
jgi:hypothetical protein